MNDVCVVCRFRHARFVGGRKRHHSEALKSELCAGLVKKCKAVNGSAARKVEGVANRSFRKWCDDDVLAYQAASVSKLGAVGGTYSLCKDGAALGLPAVDTKSYSLYHPGLHLAIWCPNQAPQLKFQFRLAAARLPHFGVNFSTGVLARDIRMLSRFSTKVGEMG